VAHPSRTMFLLHQRSRHGTCATSLQKRDGGTVGEPLTGHHVEGRRSTHRRRNWFRNRIYGCLRSSAVPDGPASGFLRIDRVPRCRAAGQSPGHRSLSGSISNHDLTIFAARRAVGRRERREPGANCCPNANRCPKIVELLLVQAVRIETEAAARGTLDAFELHDDRRLDAGWHQGPRMALVGRHDLRR